METERQQEFRRLLIPEMTRQELEDRLVEYHGRIDELKSALAKYSIVEEKEELDWDKIIGGMANYLEIEYKRLYGIPSEEFFHFLVCYMEENHPQYFVKKVIDWETIVSRYKVYCQIHERNPMNNSYLFFVDFLKKQPEFN